MSNGGQLRLVNILGFKLMLLNLATLHLFREEAIDLKHLNKTLVTATSDYPYRYSPNKSADLIS